MDIQDIQDWVMAREAVYPDGIKLEFGFIPKG
jgi:hypothetical protein